MKKSIFNPETVIFVKPVIRQNSGMYTLRMIARVAYTGLPRVIKIH